jgi:hypothetical protein
MTSVQWGVLGAAALVGIYLLEQNQTRPIPSVIPPVGGSAGNGLDGIAAPITGPYVKNNPLYSPSGLIPGASNPFAFGGQTNIEQKVAVGAGSIATIVAGRVPIVGPLATRVAGPDTTVNVTQTERAAHGVTDIATGHWSTGAKAIGGAVVTSAVQPIKSAVGFVESIF